MIRHDRGGLLSFLDRRKVERLLGVPLPKGARRVHYLLWRPSDHLAYHEALIRFEADRDAYLSFVHARGLTPFSESGPDVHLPIDWSPAPEITRPRWWNPTPATPPDAASGKVGLYGSLAAKWEDGKVFVLIEDTGHRERR
ncbi:MAG: hypothetical protein ACOZCP_13660 [Pseudomonadota bacterium]